MKIPKFKTSIAVALALLVSACGNAGKNTELRDSYVDETNRLLNKFQYSSATPAYAIPISGSAKYTGISVVSYYKDSGPDETVLVGNATVNANFATDTVSTSMGAFLGGDGTTADGGLTMNNAVIIGDTFYGTATGTIAYEGDSTRFNMDGEGQFLNISANGVAIYMDGTATTGSHVDIAEAGVLAD